MRITPELANIDKVAQALGDLRDRFVFAGASVLSCYISPSGPAAPRATKDVDMVVEVATFIEDVRLSEELRKRGFSEDITASIKGRWKLKDLTVDIIQASPNAPGAVSPWLEHAQENAILVVLPSGLQAQVLSPAYWVAAKLQAFLDRGLEDILVSHDLEDIIFLIDSEDWVESAIQEAPASLRSFVALALNEASKSPYFREALEGCIPVSDPDQSRFRRAEQVVRRLAAYVP